MFKMQTTPDPDFTPEQRELAAKAAGKVVSSDADSRDTPSPGRATRPLGAPDYPKGQDGSSAGVVGAQTPEAA